MIVIDDRLIIPASVLRDRRLSILESIVEYLHDHKNMRFSEISRLLGRDQRTIWTVYNRCRVKRARQK